jgi:hypothetical protein
VSDITIEPEDTTFDDFLNSLPALPSTDMSADQAEIDALIAELAQDYPTTTDLDTTQPEIDPQELENWLDSLEPTSSFDMDL